MDCKEYLTKIFPAFDYTDISQSTTTLTQYPHIRFELGGDLKSCSDERLHQAYFRSFDLIQQIFNSTDELLYLLVNDYGPGDFFTNTPSEYVYTLITDYRHHDQEELVYVDDEDKKQKFLQNIYTLQWSQIDYKKILEGIANLEQGREPGVSQAIFFINFHDDIIFYMYDDRGCLIASKTADKIRKIYQKKNDWIVEYHRPEIEKYFL